MHGLLFSLSQNRKEQTGKMHSVPDKIYRNGTYFQIEGISFALQTVCVLTKIRYMFFFFYLYMY